MNVAGKIVVITGGGSGIGKAMAHAFHRAGAAKIVVADIDAEARTKWRRRSAAVPLPATLPMKSRSKR